MDILEIVGDFVMDNFARKRVVVLGSTGSVGSSTLDIIRKYPDRFEVLALTAAKNVDLLLSQIEEFKPKLVVVKSEREVKNLESKLPEALSGIEIWFGEKGYCTAASLSDADIVVSAIVGAVGLLPTYEAVKAGKVVALANKESMVIAGEIITRLAKKTGATILPVDSEHNAVFQVLQGHDSLHLKRIILTASGGPFFGKSKSEIESVSPEVALKHPNWSMGSKITIDSATLMNKGLELIEAKWLFDVPMEMIDIVVHPESIIHSMVEFVDGSILAEMAVPDMRIPIAYALSYPERLNVGVKPLDLLQIGRLTFLPPDEQKFPCLKLAKEACRVGHTMPTVLNAANEEAVYAFLNHRIGFYDIPRLIESVMNEHRIEQTGSVEQVLSVDAWARKRAQEILKEWEVKRKY